MKKKSTKQSKADKERHKEGMRRVCCHQKGMDEKRRGKNEKEKGVWGVRMLME